MADDLIVAATVITGGALFAWGRPPMPFVALGMTAILLVTGVIDPFQAGAGLGHPATLVIICMFILSAAVQRAGIVDVTVHWILRAARDRVHRFRALLLGTAAGASSILNNTPVVAMAIPVVATAAERLRQRPSRFLIPLSYASMLGGMITLLGTRANVVASEVLRAAGLAPFGLFEWTWLGLTLTVVGLVYLLLVADHLMPRRGSAEAPRGERVYLVEARAGPGAAGKVPRDLAVLSTTGLRILQIGRGARFLHGDLRDRSLAEGDLLVLEGRLDDIDALHEEDALEMLPEREAGGEDETLMEVIVPPGSPLEGRSLQNTRFLRRHVGHIMAVRKGGRGHALFQPGLRIEAGDMLLVRGDAARFDELRDSHDLIPLSAVERTAAKRRHAPWVLAVIVFVLVAVGLEWLSLPGAALIGAIAVVAGGTVSLRDVQAHVRWDVVLILAGTIPVGIAMESSGLAARLADAAGGVLEGRPVWLVLLGVYVATNLLTALVTNTACVVLMAPIALQVAAGTGLDPRVVMAAVMIASSADFNTPIGYETNTMVSGPGGYRFTDYLKAGLPLTLLVAALTTAMLTPLAMR